MAITTRETTATGVTNKGAPLTNAEVDTNFIELQQDKIELTDLSVTTNSAGAAALSYNDTSGVFSYTPPDLSSYLTTEANDLTAAVTWANVPDANITESSVTQHEAALTVTSTQVSDFAEAVDDQVNVLLQAGLGIDLDYDDVSGELTIDSNHVEVNCTNNSGASIAIGTPVYQTGVSGNNITIAPADADDAAKMPAIGMTTSAIANGASGTVVILGVVNGLDTSSFTAGDTVYVGTTAGSLTTTAPTGESGLIQNFGRVLKVNASSGSIAVMGAGRANAVPNLNDGNVFIGNASNQAEARALVEADISDFGTYIGLTDLSVTTNAVGTAALSYNNTTGVFSYTPPDLSSYLTSYTETDTLDSVTGRGATTTNAVTVGNLTSTGIDDNATSTALTIDSSENVGIGTASPAEKLDIAGVSSANGMKIGANGTDINSTFLGASSIIAFKCNSTERMRIDGSGNVGIGTTSPDAKLDVKASTATVEVAARFRKGSTADAGGHTTLIGLGTEDATWSKSAIGHQRNDSYDVGDLIFCVNANATSGSDVSTSDERMRITSSGSVKIGNSSAGGTVLGISDGAFDGTNYGSVQVVKPLDHDGAWHYSMVQAGNQIGGMGFYDNVASTMVVGIGAGPNLSSASQHVYKTNALQSYVGGTERMRIDSNGNVGIGTASPAGLLDLGVSTGQKLLMYSNSNIKYGQAIQPSEYQMFAEDQAVMTFGHMARSDGTTYTERMRIDASGNVGINTASPIGHLDISNDLADGSVDFTQGLVFSSNGGSGSTRWSHAGITSTGSTGFNGSLVFGTDGNSASSTSITERMRIDSQGDVGINITNPTEKLHVGGNILATGNITAYSDERLKSDVKTLDGSKVYEMRGVSFTKDGEDGSGVIAQELQKVAPELVNDSGEYLSVAYGNLVGYLIEAVKDLKAEIEELKNGSSD